MAFNSPLAMCKALGGPLGMGSTSDVANCIRWAHDKDAEVVSVAATDNRDQRASFSNANSDVEITATAATIRLKLDASVDDLGAAGRDTSFGFGRVNLQKAATS